LTHLKACELLDKMEENPRLAKAWTELVQARIGKESRRDSETLKKVANYLETNPGKAEEFASEMKQKVFIRERKGNEVEAWLEISESDVQLTLTYREKKIHKIAEDLFLALILIRKDLEKEGIQLICNGASVDVFPSRMMRDMGGEKAYRLKIGSPAKMADVVDIFDVDREAFIPGTVAEQEQYYELWVQTKKKRE